MTQLQARRSNVLAVDDYPANLVALEVVLGADCNLIVAHSGAEALTILQSRSDIDVILMDVQMPAMDGYDTVRLIKKMPGCEDIPVIFVTAIYKEDPFVRKGYEAGAVDYFSKPFDPEILRMKVGVYASFRQRAEVLRERERQAKETEELLKTGRKLSAVLESLPVGVMIADHDGRVCQVNQQVSRICGSTATADGDAYGELLQWWAANGDLIREKSAPLSRAIREGRTSHNQVLHIRCLSGSEKTVLCSASPLLALDGHIVGAVVILQDVTESKQIEEDLENRITNLVSAGVRLDESINH